MTIFTEDYTVYEYNNKYDCLNDIESLCHGIKKSLRLVEKDKEHLTLRCPLSGDYIDVVGIEEELEWLDNQLNVRKWYRST